MLKTKPLLRQGYIVVLAGVVLFTSACGAQKALQPIAVPEHEQTVKADVIEAAGKIKAKDSRNIILDFSAAIQAVSVKDGQRVSLGEELMTLDIHEIKQQILDKENALRTEQLQLERIQNDSKNSEAMELSALQTAQEELRRANEDLVIKQTLFEAGAIAKAELDVAQRRVDDAGRKVADKQVSQANTFRLNIEIEKQKISALESDVLRMKDKLNKSYIQGDKVLADIKNGLVQESTHVSGDFLPANTKLLSLVNMDTLVVEAEVSEDFIKDVKVGAEVEIFPIADSSKQYKGRVLRIADMGINKNGETVIVTEISIDNGDEFIRPDFNVDVKISK